MIIIFYEHGFIMYLMQPRIMLIVLKIENIWKLHYQISFETFEIGMIEHLLRIIYNVKCIYYLPWIKSIFANNFTNCIEYR